MKPNFALTLSFDGIGLLHRAFPGWHHVGDVALDTSDLQGDLSALRARAEALDPSGIRAKLVIPNDQIKYLTIPAPDGTVEDAVRAALDGATPYDVDDLAYDWCLSDGAVKIAAVARETLTEAEAFAADHAFGPLSFVAIPDNGDFLGEPFFGPTAHAAKILPEGVEVTRDTAAVRVVGSAKLPVTPDEPDEAAAPDAAPAPAHVPTPDPAPEAEPAVKAAAKAAPEAEPEAAPETQPVGQSPASKADLDPPDVIDDGDDADDDTDEKDAVDGDADDSKDAPPPASAAFSSIRAHRDIPGDTAPRLAGASRLSRLDEADLARALSPGAADAEQARKRTPPPPLRVDPAPAPDAAVTASLRPDPAERLSDPEKPAASEMPGALAAFLSKRGATPLSDAPEALKAEPRETAPGKAARPAKAKKSFFKVKPRAKPAPTTTHADEKRRMTVFGAREQEIGGKPRFLGLILFALLLLFLVGVAAWASIFLDDGLARLLGGPRDIRIADGPVISQPDEADAARISEDGDPLPDSAPPEDPVLAAVSPDARMPERQPVLPLDDTADDNAAVPDTGADTAIDTGTGTGTDSAPDPAAETTPDAATAPVPDEAMANYAATGIWQMPPEAPEPPGTNSREEVYQASVDPAVTLGDISELPMPSGEVTDLRPDTPADPPPAGTVFDLDARGIVRATPEGAATPSGVVVYAGRPAATPPEIERSAPAQASDQTPDGAAQPETDAVADTGADAAPDAQAEDQTDGQPDSAFIADPRLATFRPQARPETVSPPDAATDGDADNDAGLTPDADAGANTSALAKLRPRLRPDSVVAQAVAVDAAAVAEALAEATSDADNEEIESDLFENPTSQAVTASLTPARRPKDFGNTVEQIRRKQSETPVATQQVLAPAIPSTASVAKQATERNVLNLRSVNLIGVYGTPNARRALVRLSNGRYKKVKVGDKLDGGSVAAIGDSELRYVKRGKAVVLTMPKG